MFFISNFEIPLNFTNVKFFTIAFENINSKDNGIIVGGWPVGETKNIKIHLTRYWSQRTWREWWWWWCGDNVPRRRLPKTMTGAAGQMQ